MANEHSLHLSVADRVLVVYCQMSCEMLKDGQAFVPARLFTDVVRQLPDGDVHLENKGSFLEITAGQNLEFRMKLPRIESKSWREPPVIASNNKADLPSDKLMYVIDQVQFCVAHESPRNYGSVGYLHKTGDSHLRLVGTDGYRLSYSQLDLEIPKDFLSEGVCLSNGRYQNSIGCVEKGLTQLIWRYQKTKPHLLLRFPTIRYLSGCLR